MPLATRDRGRQGVVLLVVLFFALLLTSSVATFVRRSTVDTLIARNLDARAEADALARGGLLLAWALLVEDRLQELAGTTPPGDNHLDAWACASASPLVTPSGTTLRLRIEDSGVRLNLNALFEMDEVGAWKVRKETPEFLTEVLAKVIDELPPAPRQQRYEPAELAANLIDFVDGDDATSNGSLEDDVYQRLSPPYRALNRPLLSFDELRLVAGFDTPLVDALRPYLTVYPFVPVGCGDPNLGCGVNLNTAPPHVLALLWFDDGVEKRLADEDTVRRILRVRSEGGLLCGDGHKLGGLHADTGDRAQRDLSAADVLDAGLRGQRRGERGGRASQLRGGDGPHRVPAMPALLSWRIR